VNGIFFLWQAPGMLARHEQITASGRRRVAALGAFAAANGLPLPIFANVPEPASATMMVMAGLGILRLRRRSPAECHIGNLGYYDSGRNIRPALRTGSTGAGTPIPQTR